MAVLGSGVDTAIQRLGRSYDVRGLTDQVTSYSDVAGTNVANQVQYLYNDFGQLAVEYQQHSGAVNTSSSPKVQYSYASGSNNTVRPTSVTYPSLNGLSGRVLSLNYSSTDDDALSRISSLSDGGGSLVNYTYLGLGSFVQSNAPQPNLTWTLIGSPGTTDPYSYLDRFGRVIDCRWTNASGDVERLQYGYNRDSSRQWRHEVLTTLNDELYTYDNLQRLIAMQRGNLALTPLLSGEGLSPVLTSPTLQQAWTLDATGNWPGFNNTESGNTFNQTRTSNAANEITAISQSTSPPPSNWATPAYNAVGNMTSMPSPSSLIPPTSSLSATYDAWNRLVSLPGLYNYAYDGLNRRISKTNMGAVVTAAYYNNQWQLLCESGPNSYQYVWGLRYIDDCVLRDQIYGPTASFRTYAFQDANWNVTGLTNSLGEVLERYRYTAYGQPTFLNADFSVKSPQSSVYAWSILYCGYRWDSESGLYYVRNRLYHPLLGCWITRDPIEYSNLFLSLYEYTASNPIYYIDSYGEVIIIRNDKITIEVHPNEDAHSIAHAEIFADNRHVRVDRNGIPIHDQKITELGPQGRKFVKQYADDIRSAVDRAQRLRDVRKAAKLAVLQRKAAEKANFRGTKKLIGALGVVLALSETAQALTTNKCDGLLAELQREARGLANSPGSVGYCHGFFFKLYAYLECHGAPGEYTAINLQQSILCFC